MAVEAARDALGGTGRDGIQGVYLASTSLPFQDRQNAGIVVEACTWATTCRHSTLPARNGLAPRP